MIRIVFALIGSGIVRYALVSIEQVPKTLANLLTALTFMSLVIMLPPFMDAVTDIWVRSGLNKVVYYAERAGDSISKAARDAIEAIKSMPPIRFDLGACAAVRYDSSGHSSYAWQGTSCSSVENAAHNLCPSCVGRISSRSTIALVACDDSRWMNAFAGTGSDWQQAENTAFSNAYSGGFARHSCRRVLILHPVSGKIG